MASTFMGLGCQRAWRHEARKLRLHTWNAPFHCNPIQGRSKLWVNDLFWSDCIDEGMWARECGQPWGYRNVTSCFAPSQKHVCSFLVLTISCNYLIVCSFVSWLHYLIISSTKTGIKCALLIILSPVLLWLNKWMYDETDTVLPSNSSLSGRYVITLQHNKWFNSWILNEL